MTEQLVLLSVKEVAQLLGVDRATIGSTLITLNNNYKNEIK